MHLSLSTDYLQPSPPHSFFFLWNLSKLHVFAYQMFNIEIKQMYELGWIYFSRDIVPLFYASSNLIYFEKIQISSKKIYFLAYCRKCKGNYYLRICIWRRRERLHFSSFINIITTVERCSRRRRRRKHFTLFSCIHLSSPYSWIFSRFLLLEEGFPYHSFRL